MTLPPGTKIGPYEIKGLLGAGGMGEVYLAWDPRLGREVALKRMTGPGAEDPEWRTRFMSEARAVAGLRHPGIVAVHDILWEESAPYIVMERLEGETLRELLHRGAIPGDMARTMWLKIVRALAAAHGQGLIHRDLKPENIFITWEGGVKILDFGLAKRLNTLEGDVTAIATSTGVILGTLTYLSPEQARGEAATRRSDVHALGLILLEMLTGRAVFRRETPAETLAAILKEDPLQGALIPPWAMRLLRSCLFKDPAQRPASAENLEDDPSQPMVLAPTPARRRPWLLAAGLAVLVAGGVWGWQRSRHSAPAISTKSPGWSALQRAEYLRSRANKGQPSTLPLEQDPVAQAYQASLGADPNLLDAHLGLADYLLGRVFAEKGKGVVFAPMAFEHIQWVLQAQPRNPRALLLRGRLSFSRSAGFPMEEALEDVSLSCRLEPGNAESRFVLGTICEHVGLLEEAARIYENAPSRARDSGYALFRLARVKWMSFDLEGARSLYVTFPPDRQWELPAVLERLGRTSEAMSVAQSQERFMQQDTAIQSDLNAVKAFLLARQGDAAGARKLAKASEEQGLGIAHFHHAAYHLACAYVAMGDEGNALRFLRLTSEEGMPCYPLFQKDPRLDPIRSSPVFKLFLEAQRVRWEGFKARYAAAQRG